MLLPLHLVTWTLPGSDISVYRSALSPAHRSRSTWPMAIASRCGCGMQAPQTTTMSCGNTCLLLWFVYLLSNYTLICWAALILWSFFVSYLFSAKIPQNKNNTKWTVLIAAPRLHSLSSRSGIKEICPAPWTIACLSRTSLCRDFWVARLTSTLTLG